MKSTYTRNTKCNIANFKHKPQILSDYAVIKIDLKTSKIKEWYTQSVINAKMIESVDLNGAIVISQKGEVI